MTLARALQVAAGNSQESADVAEAIDFDGTNDYLLANSLTGAADSKTFTLSAWVWPSSANEVPIYAAARNNLGTVNFYVYVTNSQELTILAYASGSTTQILNVNLPASAFAKNTFNHLLISFDMASTSNRSIYINDVAVSPTYSVYTNTPLLFSTNTYRNAVATEYIFNTANSKANGRLSNVYLDYTYRNLSITANRRLFVTADLKPAADQAALNPILYLPMSDPTAPGVNAGTGGNFTLTGTVARSGRGPNQYNAPYSDLDGSNDFLTRSSLTGAADGKQLTVSFVFNADDLSAGDFVFSINQSSSFLLYITTKASPGNGGGLIEIYAKNTSAATGLQTSTQLTSVAANRNYHVVMSFDLTDTNKRHIAVNGQLQTLNVQAYLDVNLDLTGDLYRVASGWSTTTRLDGRLGALWFNTSYIDLSVATNLAKFVTGTGIDAKPVDLGANGELPTGTSPLIYLPMYGNNAGKNYGTGGDFTVNSGPYTGARGPNEYWGNLADFNGTTGYLTKASVLTGITNSKTLTISFAMYMDVLSGQYFFTMGDSSTTRNRGVQMHLVSGGTYRLLDVYAYNSAGSQILNARLPLNMVAGVLYYVQFSADLSDTAKRSAYINGAVQSVTWNTYTNSDISFSTATYLNVGRDPVNTAEFYNGKLSEFYLSNQYVDFSQEANRLKFRDAFGNPVNLTQQIEDAAIPNPAIYMRFPPTAFGTNSGTGGNFTVNGTITDGGQL